MDNIKSLKSLCIKPDSENKHFHCRETTQQKLINTTFNVLDYIDGVKTKFGASRYIVKIQLDNGDVQKFFTNSQEIKYTLGEVKKMEAFPVRVTMRAEGSRYFLE